MRSLRKRASKGFTLVELLVVILIVGILAGVAVPIYMNQKTRAYRTSAVMDGHATAATISSGLFGLTSFGDANGTIVVDASVKPATVTVALGGSGSTSSPSVLYAAMTAGSTASGVTYANTTSWCLDIANNNQHVIYTEAGVSSTQTSCGTTPGTNGGGVSSVSGGVLSSDATYYYQTFLADGTLTVTGSLAVDALIIGGGGSSWNSGGGAGGVLYAPTTAVTTNSYPIVVGGADTNSSFNSLVGLAGGKSIGIADNTPYAAGGSGAGGAYNSAGGHAAGTGTAGQGFAGGEFVASSNGASGGGGGAGGPGLPGSGVATGGVGTAAYSSWGLVTGTGENIAGIVYYAGGGGGWSGGGPGGAGGGASSSGRAPIANTGGGGATSHTAGATGIVIIRYLKSAVGG